MNSKYNNTSRKKINTKSEWTKSGAYESLSDPRSKDDKDRPPGPLCLFGELGCGSLVAEFPKDVPLLREG